MSESDAEKQQKPWERPGYGYGGPIDPLHDTKINARLSREMDVLDRALPDLGAAVVVFSHGEDDISVLNLQDDSPVNGADLQAIRQQHVHLR